MTKPRLRKQSDGRWVCSDSITVGVALTPKEAYGIWSVGYIEEKIDAEKKKRDKHRWVVDFVRCLG